MISGSNLLCRVKNSYNGVHIPDSAVGYVEFTNKEQYKVVFVLPQGSVRMMIRKDQLELICLKEILL
jgi:hypothetical protein